MVDENSYSIPLVIQKSSMCRFDNMDLGHANTQYI